MFTTTTSPMVTSTTFDSASRLQNAIPSPLSWSFRATSNPNFSVITPRNISLWILQQHHFCTRRSSIKFCLYCFHSSNVLSSKYVSFLHFMYFFTVSLCPKNDSLGSTILFYFVLLIVGRKQGFCLPTDPSRESEARRKKTVKGKIALSNYGKNLSSKFLYHLFCGKRSEREEIDKEQDRSLQLWSEKGKGISQVVQLLLKRTKRGEEKEEEEDEKMILRSRTTIVS
ncbi:uncharacterized protein LOC130724504 isoform X2 [Lotus japonicus]|uniref:uncharacterized protein LOC130724504 isoform X2 n=1 Tax=Lotus japonicus TaxID=34305 RepID=UPI002584CA3E|nr:uncharacterized protein LOC130724504 isoform X2 [Lotus japonicus]XP_057431724.1 uncharacterized protein LOC130724504 isoform X2 [Lotus japonicus]